MSREMQILDGPNFKELIFGTNLFNERGTTVWFRMDELVASEISGGIKTWRHNLSFMSVGQTKTADDFIIIATTFGLEHAVPVERVDYYYVIHYNVISKKGDCVEYSKEEFFADSIVREMYG